MPVVYEPVQQDGHSYARRGRVERMFRMVMMVRPPRWRRMEMVGMVSPEQGRPGLWVEAGRDTRYQHLE